MLTKTSELTEQELIRTLSLPDLSWHTCGPIIERESISVVRQGDNPEWVASVYNYPEDDWHLHTEGDTPLIAAMRCFVASKLGEEIDVPEELV